MSLKTPTRIINFQVSDPNPTVGETVQVSGVLQLQSIFDGWEPAPGFRVNVYADSQEIGETLTAGDGSFSVQWTPQAAGTYAVQAVFPGTQSFASSTSQSIPVTVTSGGQLPWWWWIAALGGGAAILTVVGVIAYQESQSQQMLLLALTSRGGG